MDKISWVASNGTEYPFEYVLKGMNGRFMPPISFNEEEVPFQPGSRLRDIKVQARDVDIPLLIKGNTEIELRQKVRDCLRRFNPLKGDGKIKVISPDGIQRELFCRYASGLEGNEGSDAKGDIWQTLVLVFRAFDPFWYDSNTIVETFTTGDPATFFPFFPLRLSSSTVFADTTIDNSGDVETWPEWIITGPGDTIILRNLTTGEVMQINADLGRGESITVDTRPFHKTVMRNNGINDFIALTDESSLWALQEGVNNIRIEMSNTTEESSIQLSYKNRYWGP